MPTIETRIAPISGAVTFRAKVRLKGAPPECASFKRKTDAVKWAQSTEVAIREGRYFKTAAAKRCTLAEAIDRYVREILPRKPRTAKFQARQLAWWRTELGHLFLADVTASAISEARAKLQVVVARRERPFRGWIGRNDELAGVRRCAIGPRNACRTGGRRG